MKRPRGRPSTINYKDMTREEQQAYQREVSRRRNARRAKPKPQIDFGDLRQCKKCNERHPRTEAFFFKQSNDKLSKTCKTCAKRAAKEWVIKNKFGGTLEEYEAIMAEAACTICGSNKRLVLDHCHDKSHVRGVLCTLCNTGIGMFADEPDRLRRAAAYLEERRNGLP